jgi:hypothetical protein
MTRSSSIKFDQLWSRLVNPNFAGQKITDEVGDANHDSCPTLSGAVTKDVTLSQMRERTAAKPLECRLARIFQVFSGGLFKT